MTSLFRLSTCMISRTIQMKKIIFKIREIEAGIQNQKYFPIRPKMNQVHVYMIYLLNQLQFLHSDQNVRIASYPEGITIFVGKETCSMSNSWIYFRTHISCLIHNQSYHCPQKRQKISSNNSHTISSGTLITRPSKLKIKYYNFCCDIHILGIKKCQHDPLLLNRKVMT